MVDAKRQLLQRCASSSTYRPSPLDRCFRNGLGCPLKLPSSTRSLESYAKSSPHKLARAKSGPPGSHRIPSSHKRQEYPHQVGQFHSSSLPEQKRWDEIPSLCQLAKEILQWADSFKVNLKAAHIRSWVRPKTASSYGSL